MSVFDPELWRRLAPIFDIALEIAPERRAAYLDEACSGDARLRAAAEELLADAERTSSFRGRPVRSPEGLFAGREAEDAEHRGPEVRRDRTPPGAGRAERFQPGLVVGGRYRIVSPLGRGGMGEVYRADDLKLGQPVALKFLPPAFETEAAMVERLLGEVRTARRVAHPYVCRVWDVGEHDGFHFLSMEYVDGESLASLLDRIGRLPRDKALEVARQLCAGLAAVHDQGILHRDLKPANVMIDGRGRVRITDFGIACLAGEVRGREMRAGTPAYMAPERLDGHEATVRGDVYALGLVLYELFTGRRPFRAATIAELRRQQEESAPPSPSQFVGGLDPAIERAILRCLARDVEERPASVRAISAALPGGGPLEAALAAGETPSPELLAASGPQGALSPRAVLLLGSSWLAAFAVVLGAAGSTSILGRVPFLKPVDALVAEARETLESLGYPQRPIDSVHTLTTNVQYLEWLRVREAGDGRWAPLEAPDNSAMMLLYRESAQYLVPTNETGLPDNRTPPLRPGDSILWINLRGRLRYFESIPPAADFSPEKSAHPDWEALLAAAGLKPADLQPTTPTLVPIVGFDARAAWSGRLHDADNTPIRVEAAAWRGKPVFLEFVYPFDSYWSSAGAATPAAADRFGTALWSVWILIILGTASLLVMRNLRLGRGDRRGAFRIAAVVFSARLLWWVVGGHHVPIFMQELYLLAMAFGRSLCAAATVWSLYIALEPTMRRLWPRSLMGWSRILAGRFRDPLVGRDLLVGSLGGLLGIISLCQLHILLPNWLGSRTPAPPFLFPGPGFYAPPAETLLGGRFVLAGLLSVLLTVIYGTLAIAILALGLRLALRREELAAIALATFFGAISWTASLGGYSWTAIGCGILGGALIAGNFLRLGLLSVAAAAFTMWLYLFFPLTLAVSAPYFGIGLIGILAAAGVAGFGAITSLGRRPLFAG